MLRNYFHYSCPARVLPAGQGNIATAPGFVNAAAGNYRLEPGSPCINIGAKQPWMGNAVDLDGRPRLDRFSRLVDMGCYEHVPPGTLFGFR